MRSAWQQASRALGRRGLATGAGGSGSGVQTCTLDDVRSVIKLEAKSGSSLTEFLQARTHPGSIAAPGCAKQR